MKPLSHPALRAFGVLGAVAAVAACAFPSGRGRFLAPVIVEGGIVRLGATLHLEPGPGFTADDVALTITNAATQATTSRVIPSAELASTILRVDPADLPGLDPKGPELPAFHVQVRQGGTNAESDVFVILDETARMPPAVPLGKAPLLGTPWSVDTEDLATNVTAAWEGTARCTTSRAVDLADAALPAGIREGLPAGTPLREFTVQGEFPRRVVTEPWTPPGVARAVLTPRTLRFVIAETAPSRLLTLQAIEADDAVNGGCR